MPARSTDNLRDREYLGDGVYAGHDGYHVVLFLEHGGSAFGPGAIALDHQVRRSLRRYLNRLEGDEGATDGR